MDSGGSIHERHARDIRDDHVTTAGGRVGDGPRQMDGVGQITILIVGGLDQSNPNPKPGSDSMLPLTRIMEEAPWTSLDVNI